MAFLDLRYKMGGWPAEFLTPMFQELGRMARYTIGESAMGLPIAFLHKGTHVKLRDGLARHTTLAGIKTTDERIEPVTRLRGMSYVGLPFRREDSVPRRRGGWIIVVATALPAVPACGKGRSNYVVNYGTLLSLRSSSLPQIHAMTRFATKMMPKKPWSVACFTPFGLCCERSLKSGKPERT